MDYHDISKKKVHFSENVLERIRTEDNTFLVLSGTTQHDNPFLEMLGPFVQTRFRSTRIWTDWNNTKSIIRFFAHAWLQSTSEIRTCLDFGQRVSVRFKIASNRLKCLKSERFVRISDTNLCLKTEQVCSNVRISAFKGKCKAKS